MFKIVNPKSFQKDNILLTTRVKEGTLSSSGSHCIIPSYSLSKVAKVCDDGTLILEDASGQRCKTFASGFDKDYKPNKMISFFKNKQRYASVTSLIIRFVAIITFFATISFTFILDNHLAGIFSMIIFFTLSFLSLLVPDSREFELHNEYNILTSNKGSDRNE